VSPESAETVREVFGVPVGVRLCRVVEPRIGCRVFPATFKWSMQLSRRLSYTMENYRGTIDCKVLQAYYQGFSLVCAQRL
jgi:hypothetical protein